MNNQYEIIIRQPLNEKLKSELLGWLTDNNIKHGEIFHRIFYWSFCVYNKNDVVTCKLAWGGK